MGAVVAPCPSVDGMVPVSPARTTGSLHELKQQNEHNLLFWRGSKIKMEAHFVIHDSVNAQQQAQLQYTMFNLYVLLLLIPGIIAHQKGPALFHSRRRRRRTGAQQVRHRVLRTTPPSNINVHSR